MMIRGIDISSDGHNGFLRLRITMRSNVNVRCYCDNEFNIGGAGSGGWFGSLVMRWVFCRRGNSFTVLCITFLSSFFDSRGSDTPFSTLAFRGFIEPFRCSGCGG